MTTRHPLSTGVFSATLIAKKNMAKERIEPTTYWLGNTKKFQAPARVRTHYLLAGKGISEVHFTRWSGDKVEFWQNLFKKMRHRSWFSSPIYVGGKKRVLHGEFFLFISRRMLIF